MKADFACFGEEFAIMGDGFSRFGGAGVLAVAISLFGGAIPAAAVSVASRVPSSFISVEQVAGWDASRWGYEFRDLKAAGISDLVLNGVAVAGPSGAVAYYPSRVPGIVQAVGETGARIDVATGVLSRARAAGMHVWLGTYLPGPDWYQPNDATVVQMTQTNASITAAVIRDLDTEYSAYRGVISGWYLSSEVSDAYSSSGVAVTALTAYYSQLVKAARAAHTTTRTMIAPYDNLDALPNQSLWTSAWTRILRAAPIGVIALQDGTGDGLGWRPPPTPATDQKQLVSKYQATRNAIAAAKTTTALWADLDFYDFFGYSKPISDLAHVAATVAPFVTGYTSWSFTSQYSPWTIGSSAFATPLGIWNGTGLIAAGNPTPPSHFTSTKHGTGSTSTIVWTSATPAAGQTIAFYRVFSANTGNLLGETTTTTWTATECVTIQTVDTTGSASQPAPSCSS
jgi:hypothetical protein